MNIFSFGKKEKLCSRDQIEALFKEGTAFTVNPLRVLYSIIPAPVQGEIRILVSVSRKKFKRSVSRNRIKRLLREAYRLNKHILLAENIILTDHLNIGFIYIGNKDDINISDVDKAMVEALLKIRELLHK